MEKTRIYLSIDLKSFYASVECIERGLNPFDVNLVVADTSRTEKTICLAISPALKEYGLSSRARLFEVIAAVKKINKERIKKTTNGRFLGKSFYKSELANNKNLELDYIAATPQMSHYIKESSKIYSIYLKYFAKEDIHVYSIDEVFIDITNYFSLYKCTPEQLATKVIGDIKKETGITATCGIGTNLFLAKVAMDIFAKHAKEDKNGVRIAFLDEIKFRRLMWDHTPLTDFWRIGPGTTRRLNAHNMFTLGDVAKMSLENEDLLYEIFGINAELIIDHAWGYEPTLIKDIKEYKPALHSLSIGQVLSEKYTYEKSLIIVKEMADALSLDLVKKNLVANQIVMSVIYDSDNDVANYKGALARDYINRIMPYPAHGTINLSRFTSSCSLITEASLKLFNHIVDKNLFTRRFFLVAGNVIDKSSVKKEEYTQLDLFKSEEEIRKEEYEINKKIEGENKLQQTLLSIKNRYGKNAVLKGTNLLEGGTTKERNKQIGGHKA